MDTQTLRAHLKARGWSQSELGRRIGISRQAISLWFKSDEASVKSAHLLNVSEALGVAAESLARSLPGFGDDHEQLRATFLWDRLYPDLDDFAIAVGHWELEAVGRLVQVSGLFVAERLLGRAIWKRFDDFKRFIHPARRRQLEGLVRWRNNQTAS